MKLKFSVLLLVIGLSLTITSCQNLCRDTSCIHGLCDDDTGSCRCDEGWTGSFCDEKIDPCSDVQCENGGTCEGGECNCPEGFSGANCEIKDSVTNSVVEHKRDDFLGEFTGSEKCDTTGAHQFDIIIVEDSSKSNGVIVKNFRGELPAQDLPMIVNNGSLLCVEQPFGFSLTDTVNATGSMTLDKFTITIDYDRRNGSFTEKCSASFERK